MDVRVTAELYVQSARRRIGVKKRSLVVPGEYDDWKVVEGVGGTLPGLENRKVVLATWSSPLQ